jgi:hypothetical protein
MDARRFNENRGRFPPQELARYAGQYVAWRPDGTSIIASSAEERDIDQAVRAAGFDPSEVVVSFVPSDDVILGAGGEL